MNCHKPVLYNPNVHDNFNEHRLNTHHPRNRFRGLPIISDQITREELEVVITQLETVLDAQVPGAIVELGCYIGTTSLFIRRVLDEQKESRLRPFHVYDSFAGLPPKGVHDSNAAGVDFEAGKLFVSKKELLNQFRSAHLQPPVVRKGWFNELTAQDMPEQIAFAFLDGDFYDSIISSLRLVWPRLAEDGRIVIDDYKRETLPGVEQAIHDFFQGKRINLEARQHKAIIAHMTQF
jgi:O-methyltransferase